MTLPSRFVASATHPRDGVVDDPMSVEDIRALVRLRGQDLVVATELGGGVRVFVNDRQAMTQRCRSQLAFHEVASGRHIEIDADELFVFDVQAIEMLPDAPGPNDALYLYGAMRGPYPERLGESIVTVDGQLTITRADLLAGLVDGVGQAFSYAPEPSGARCLHALVPGERADRIAAGRGVILALPLPPAWSLDAGVPNDRVAGQMLYDVLRALRHDLGIRDELPVPSRAALEAELRSKGWTIEGNVATRAKGRGVLGSVFGGSERRTLPREASFDELLSEAVACLAKVPGVPSAEVVALRRIAARTVRPVDLPRPSTPAPPPVPPERAPRPRIATPANEWMKDFVDAHRPAVTAPRELQKRPTVKAPARAVTPAATPEWMKDFDTDDDDEESQDEPKRPAPDWSKDFE